MKRGSVLVALIGVGALCIAVSGSQPAAKKAVHLQTMNVHDILYVLSGGGGNSLALMRDDGVVLVDSKLAGWGQPVLDVLRTVTDKPVTMIINTHSHGDHVGGNLEYPTVTRIVAHENTKVNMQKMDAFKDSNSKFLPNKTLTDRMSLLDGPDRIDLYYFGAGHTNGDIVVVFPDKHVAHIGDLFPSKEAPLIDTENGGSGVAFPQTLARAVAEIKGVERVITGHGVVPSRVDSADRLRGVAPQRWTTWNDLQEYAEFTRDFLSAAQQAFKEGKSVDEAATGLRLPEKYKDYGMARARANVQAIYAELKK